MSGLFEELKRRNVVRVGIAYVVVAWLILQFSDLVLENMSAPAWLMQAIMLLLAIGMPLALFFAWAFELTPEGLKTTKEVDRSQSVTHSTGRKLDRIIIGVLVIAVGYFLWERQQPTVVPEAAGERMAGVASPDAGDTVQADAPGADAEPARRSIAVLPFVNMSSDDEQEWFADGLTEEILNSLARTPDLLVSARTSSFAYKDSKEDLPTIAAALGVEHVLEGSVRRSGDRLRVTAQLIRANDGFHLWSQNYDRDVADLIDIQENVAIEIAQALKTAIDPEALARFVSSGTQSIAAYEAYLRGNAKTASSFDSGDIYEQIDAKEAYEEAISIDPHFALAYWQLASFWQIQTDVTLTHTGVTELSVDEVREKLDAAIDKAIEYEQDPARKLFYRANKEYESLNIDRALQLNTEYLKQRPNNHDAQNFQLALLMELGNYDAFRDIAQIFYDRDGYDIGVTSGSLIGLLYTGDMEQLRAMTEVALERFGESNAILYQVHRALLWTGDIDGASKILPAIEASDLPETVRILSSTRQACAEKRFGDAERYYKRAYEFDGEETVTIWLMNKITGRDAIAEAYLREYDTRGDISTMSNFLSYGSFDPRVFPNLMEALGDQMDGRGALVEIPYRCSINN
jgi:TolB-like protein